MSVVVLIEKAELYFIFYLWLESLARKRFASAHKAFNTIGSLLIMIQWVMPHKLSVTGAKEAPLLEAR